MAKAFRYQHLRSLVPDVEPSVDIIREGEIAVNLYAGKERMFLKNTNNQIVRFISEAEVDAKIASGSSGSVEEKIEALSGAIDTNTANIGTLQVSASTLNTDKFGDVRYVSRSKRINFYSASNSDRVLAWIDTTDFVKDGMVDSVEVKDIGGKSYLVITFNTDSGKQPIQISISDIFDASNYYTKSEVDSLLSGKADVTSTYTKTEVDNKLSGKADKTDTYTKSDVDNKLGNKADKSELTDEVNRAVLAESDINDRIDNLVLECGIY